MKVNAAPIAPTETPVKLPKDSPEKQDETIFQAIKTPHMFQGVGDSATGDESWRQIRRQPVIATKSGIPIVSAAVHPQQPAALVQENIALVETGTPVPENSAVGNFIDPSTLDAMRKTITRVTSRIVDDPESTLSAKYCYELMSKVLQQLRNHNEAKSRLPFLFEGDPLHQEFMKAIHGEIEKWRNSQARGSATDKSLHPQNGAADRGKESDIRNSVPAGRTMGRQLPRSSGSRSNDTR